MRPPRRSACGCHPRRHRRSRGRTPGRRIEAVVAAIERIEAGARRALERGDLPGDPGRCLRLPLAEEERGRPIEHQRVSRDVARFLEHAECPREQPPRFRAVVGHEATQCRGIGRPRDHEPIVDALEHLECHQRQLAGTWSPCGSPLIHSRLARAHRTRARPTSSPTLSISATASSRIASPSGSPDLEHVGEGHVIERASEGARVTLAAPDSTPTAR